MSSLPCPPERWARFSELLDSAMDLPEPMRANWLEALTGDLACAEARLTPRIPDWMRLPEPVP